MRECRSGQTGRTQDPLAFAYAGSNPVSRIYIMKRVKTSKIQSFRSKQIARRRFILATPLTE